MIAVGINRMDSVDKKEWKFHILDAINNENIDFLNINKIDELTLIRWSLIHNL